MSIETQIMNLLMDKERINKLLLIEKERRGVNREELIFIGISNIA